MHHTGKRNDNNNTAALPYLKSKISGNVCVPTCSYSDFFLHLELRVCIEI